MGTKLDLDLIYCLNLFSKITKVRTKYCFKYNGWLIYVVPPKLLQKSLGEKGENLKKISNILKIKVKIIPSATMGPFVQSIIYPIKFKKLTRENKEVIIAAGMNSKASLIGRNKVRMKELERILKQYFGIKSLKII